MKHFSSIAFSNRSIGSNEKLFPPFEVCSNDTVTKWSLPPNFEACIADSPLLRTLLAIRQKPWQSSFSEVIDSFVLVAYASLAASRTLLQQLLADLNFTLDSDDQLLVQMKKMISTNYDSSTSCWKP